MKKMKLYEPDDQMLALIRDNYNVLQSLSAFGIGMGFGTKTVKEVCEADGVDTFTVSKDKLPCNILELLAVETSVFPSKGECRKMIQGGGVSINKEKVTDINAAIGEESILDGKYILAQRGKKNYYIRKVE